jgi:hypothetical protein
VPNTFKKIKKPPAINTSFIYDGYNERTSGPGIEKNQPRNYFPTEVFDAILNPWN